MKTAYIFLLVTLHLLHDTYSSSSLSDRKITINPTDTHPSTASPSDSPSVNANSRLDDDNVVLYSIRVTNGMTENVYLNCVSGEVLLGTGVVGPGQDVRSTFSKSDGETIVYTCDFQWRQKKTNIQVFNGDISGKCGSEYHNYCYWMVRSDGFYFNNKLKPFPHGWNKLCRW